MKSSDERPKTEGRPSALSHGSAEDLIYRSFWFGVTFCVVSMLLMLCLIVSCFFTQDAHQRADQRELDESWFAELRDTYFPRDHS